MATMNKSLVFRMKLDDSDFTQGMKLTQTEVRRMKKELESTLSPAEKAQLELKKFDKIVEKGGEEMGEYAEHIQRVRKKYLDLVPAATRAEDAIGGVAKTQKTELPGATKAVGSNAAGWQGLAGNLKGFLVGGAIAVGVTKFFGAVVSGAQKAMQFVTDLSGHVRELGSEIIQQQKLGLDGDTFAAAKMFAAADSSVNVDNIVDAMKDMRVRISEAATDGTGTGMEMLEILGLDPKQLNAMDTATQFQVIAGAIRGLSNEADRLRVVDELFGDPGFALLQAIEASPTAFDDAANAAREFGVVLSDEEQNTIMSMNRALGELGVVGEGIWTQLALAAGDSFTEMIEAVKDLGLEIIAFVKDNQPLIEEFFRSAQGLVMSFAGAIEWLSTRMDDFLWVMERAVDIASGLPGFSMAPEAMGDVQQRIAQVRRDNRDVKANGRKDDKMSKEQVEQQKKTNELLEQMKREEERRTNANVGTLMFRLVTLT